MTVATPVENIASAGADVDAPVAASWRTRSPRLRRLRHLPALLGAPAVAWRAPAGPSDVVVGWGRRDWAERDAAAAAGRGLPFLRLEDGFVRSIGLGVAGAEPFGVVVDRSGIYYDATRASDLETLIASDPVVDERAAGALIARLVAGGVAKYNHTWRPPELPARARPRVLVVDQTRGDLSVGLGLADAGVFTRMLDAARAEHPGAEIVIKTHPDVIAGRRQGYLAGGAAAAGAALLAADCNPQLLLAAVDHVYTVTSQLGFEALLAGVPVRCFGMPFYAGWGLTADALVCPRRGLRRSLAQVFWAAYCRYTRYVDPITGARCGLDRVLDRIADHRQAVAADPGGRCWCLGFSRRKRRFVADFLPGSDCRFAADAAAARRRARPGDRVLAWSHRGGDAAIALARDLGTPLERMEDGFIRSVGLGSDFVAPSSLIVDRRGIYFDPRQPSDLEHLLASHDFTAGELARGRALIARLRAAGVTKYNTGATAIPGLDPGGRRVVLVPGQVEDDQSIRTGCIDVRTNADLLRAVRAAAPEAFIVYKPHPDVLAGNRRGVVAATTGADLVVTDVDMAACLRVVDEVHTMTSLSGFEALVHGKAVHTYGLPFYAGWQLTRDRHACSRRGRRLPLEALVVAALALHPRYLHRPSRLFTGPEAIIDQIAARRAAPLPAAAAPRWRRWLGKLGNLIARPG